MYNGIGLQTAKGSGTNGYVQKNVASINHQRADFKQMNKDFKTISAEPVFKVKKANPELLLHEQKRKVEIDLIKLEDELRKAGMGEEEIEKNVMHERRQMLAALDTGHLKYDSELDKKDSHQLALDKEKQLMQFENALRIDKDHVHGKAFDQELQAQERMERMQQRAEMRSSASMPQRPLRKRRRKPRSCAPRPKRRRRKRRRNLQS